MLSTVWHTKKISSVIQDLETDLEGGLSSAEATSRLHHYGHNDIVLEDGVSAYKIFLRQFASFIVVILAIIFGALMYMGVGDYYLEALTVLIILFANIIIKYILQMRVESHVQILKGQVFHRTSVIRDGNLTFIDVRDLVPGDVIYFRSGDRVPADARIVESSSLVIDEASITNTIEPVEKSEAALEGEDLPITERLNMAYAGSFVVQGSGKAIVTATGVNTALGEVLKTIRRLDEEPHSQLKLTDVNSRFLIPISMAMGAIIAVTALFAPNGTLNFFEESFKIAMSFVVASTPSNLAVIAGVILAYNAHKMLQRGASLKRLIDLEKLAMVDTLCVEQESSLSQTEMSVKYVFVDGQLIDERGLEEYSRLPDSGEEEHNDTLRREVIDLQLLFTVAVVTATTNGNHANALGNAIVTAAGQIGVDKSEYDTFLTEITQLPYETGRRRKTLLLKDLDNQYFIFVIGDTDAVLTCSSYMQIHGRKQRLSNTQSDTISHVAARLSDNSDHILAVAYRQLDTPVNESEIQIEEDELVFLGLLGLDSFTSDGIKQAIRGARESGLDVIMTTSNPKTETYEIAGRLELAERDSELISGDELRDMSDEEYFQKVEHFHVYCETSPDDKLRMVQTLQQRGRAVAFMGSQPEDVMPISEAEMGITLREGASDATLENANLSLHDGSFEFVTNIIAQARETISSIRNSVRYLLSCSIGQSLVILIAFLIYVFSKQEFAMPLTLSQVIWINLLSIVLPILALSRDTIGVSINQTRLFAPQTLFANGYKFDVFIRGVIIALIALVGFSYYAFFPNNGVLDEPKLREAKTVACTILILTQLIFCFQCHRRPGESLIERLTANKSLLITSIIVIGLQFAAIYTKPFSDILGMTQTIGWQHLLGIGLLSLIALLLAVFGY